MNGGPLHCSPGNRLSLHASWSGHDFPGQATIRGITYPVGSLSLPSSMFVEFGGAVVLPPIGPAGTAVMAPFTFHGGFSHQVGHSFFSETLVGSGTAILSISPATWDPAIWQVTTARYDFSTSAVPEPSTLALLGTAVIGIAGRAWRRSRRH
jgi:hypothetical protein